MTTQIPLASVGSRISYGGNTCTVRFVGKIPPWDVVAYGVEWDNPEKGKHDGTLEGVKYFECVIKGTGSFVKSTRKPDPSISFHSALKQKYENKGQHDLLIQVSASKVIETFDKSPNYQLDDDANGISTASLGSLNIHDQQIPIQVFSAGINLANLKTLDLSYNLFTSVDSIANICHGLPALRELNLNGNKISKGLSLNLVAPQVTVLSLSNTDITIDILKSWIKLFPNITDLNLFKNNISQCLPLSGFSHLSTLDISYNKLLSIPPKSELPSALDNLLISHNNIEHVAGGESGIKLLDISHNCILEWYDFDAIYKCYPKIIDLKINNNKFNVSDDAYLVEMARWGGTSPLERLDGLRITENILDEAEIYFINRVREKKIPFDTSTLFWKKLLIKHDITETSSSTTKRINISANILNISVNYEGKSKNIKCMKNDTIQKLKGNIGRLFRVSTIQSELYYYDPELQKKLFMEEQYQTVSYYGVENGSVLYLVKNS